MEGVSHRPCHCSWFACTRRIAFETKSESIFCATFTYVSRKRGREIKKPTMVATEKKGKQKSEIFFLFTLRANVLTSIVASTS